MLTTMFQARVNTCDVCGEPRDKVNQQSLQFCKGCESTYFMCTRCASLRMLDHYKDGYVVLKEMVCRDCTSED